MSIVTVGLPLAFEFLLSFLFSLSLLTAEGEVILKNRDDK